MPARHRTAFIAAALSLVAGSAGAQPSGDTERLFLDRAAAECTRILNTRDAAVVEAGRAASIEVLRRVVAGEGMPPQAEVEALRSALADYATELRRSQDALWALGSAPESIVDDWWTIVQHADALLGPVEARRDVLEAGVWDGAAIRTTAGDVDAVEAAAAALGFERRDCIFVFTAPGIPADHSGFTPAAANACRTIVERRQDNAFADHADAAISAVLRNLSDEPVMGDGLPEALAALAKEWTATLADFWEVPTADVPDPAEWEKFILAAEDRARIYQGRADALASGDAAQIAAAFQPGPGVSPGDLAALGLEMRDCLAIVF